MEDVDYIWQHGQASIEGVDKVSDEMAQFTLTTYKTTKRVQTFSTGRYDSLFNS